MLSTNCLTPACLTNTGAAVNLDYVKCFDTTAPQLAARILTAPGLPHTVTTVFHVWEHQQQHTQPNGAATQWPTTVTRSHTKKALCPALNIILSAPLRDIQRHMGPTLKHHPLGPVHHGELKVSPLQKNSQKNEWLQGQWQKPGSNAMFQECDHDIP